MNKGFTLVELLAVIIILALLGLVSIVGVTTLIGKTKTDINSSQMKSIEIAAKEWATENIDILPSTGECIYITLGDLKTYGILDDNIVNAITSEKLSDGMKIMIEAYTNTYNNIQYTYTVDASDVTGCRYMYGDYTLKDGVTVNILLKRLANNQDVSIDSRIKSIVFLKPGQIPSYIQRSEFNSYTSVDLSNSGNSGVIAYYHDGVVYIYSDGILQSNEVSDSMFSNLSALESIDFSGFNTQNVVSMSSMFSGCSNLRILNLSKFDTSNVVRMDNMFTGCANLRELDISSFETSKVSTYTNMFRFCNDLNVTVSKSSKSFIEARLIENGLTPYITVK